MEVVVTTGAISHAKLQSNHHHQQTNIRFFFTGWMPFLSPNQQCQALNGKYHIPWTCLHQDHLVLPTLSLTTNSSWLPWGRVAMPLISPLMPVPQTLYVDFSEFTVRLQNVFWNTRGKQEKDCNLEKEQCGKCPPPQHSSWICSRLLQKLLSSFYNRSMFLEITPGQAGPHRSFNKEHY